MSTQPVQQLAYAAYAGYDYFNNADAYSGNASSYRTDGSLSGGQYRDISYADMNASRSGGAYSTDTPFTYSSLIPSGSDFFSINGSSETNWNENVSTRQNLRNTLITGARPNILPTFSALGSTLGLTSRTPEHTNIRQYGDDSVIYDYGGNANDQILNTPSNWAGNGVPLAATQGAQGWAVTRPLPAGDEFTRDELFDKYGLYWQGPSTGDVVDASKQLYGEMTDITRGTSQQMANALYSLADAKANATIQNFPAVSGRALEQTQIAEKSLSQDMSAQFIGNLDAYLPGWRENINRSGALTQGANAISSAFKQFYPQLAYDTLETTALLRNASRPMLAGEVPMSVSMAALQGNRAAYSGSSAAGRGLTARDLGLNTSTMRQLGTAGLTMAGKIQPYLQQAAGTIVGTPADFARSHAASVGQFVAPSVDTSSLYGSLMAGLSKGSEMSPDQIFNLGMTSYGNEVQTGMNTFAMLQELAMQQTEAFNANKPT